jgi:hypothetical protein
VLSSIAARITAIIDNTPIRVLIFPFSSTSTHGEIEFGLANPIAMDYGLPLRLPPVIA